MPLGAPIDRQGRETESGEGYGRSGDRGHPRQLDLFRKLAYAAATSKHSLRQLGFIKTHSPRKTLTSSECAPLSARQGVGMDAVVPDTSLPHGGSSSSAFGSLHTGNHQLPGVGQHETGLYGAINSKMYSYDGAAPRTGPAKLISPAAAANRAEPSSQPSSLQQPQQQPGP